MMASLSEDDALLLAAELAAEFAFAAATATAFLAAALTEVGGGVTILGEGGGDEEDGESGSFRCSPTPKPSLPQTERQY